MDHPAENRGGFRGTPPAHGHVFRVDLDGLIGALLAVPLTAAIKVLYKRYIWQNASMRPMTEPVLPPEHPGEQPPDTPEGSALA